jgi:CRP-like cAMP-binding protein
LCSIEHAESHGVDTVIMMTIDGGARRIGNVLSKPTAADPRVGSPDRSARAPLVPSSADDPRPKNRLLAALPAADFARLRSHLTTVPIHVRQVLHAHGEPIRQVYFPNGGVVSITTKSLSTGTMVEAATVGDEGMLGVEAFFSEDACAAGETFMQVPDTDAEILSVDVFRREIATQGALHRAVARYIQYLLAMTMQSTACNALHPVEQRCARWLLMTHTRMHRQDFTLSHEFLGMMLGVHRPTVSLVAGTLQRAGLIEYTHGRVTVLDREGLEAASCECYAVLRAHFQRLRL